LSPSSSASPSWADIRATVKAGFQEIQAAIAPMLQAKPRRRVTFTDQ
jgi:hypothetical protein